MSKCIERAALAQAESPFDAALCGKQIGFSEAERYVRAVLRRLERDENQTVLAKRPGAVERMGERVQGAREALAAILQARRLEIGPL